MTNNKTITTCVILAAGKGSRWAPISGYLPKEMLPLIDRPVIDWVIDEVITAGCTEIVIVINKHKELIRNYISNKKSHKKVKFHFVYQEKPLGITDAIFRCQKIINNQPFAMALPDLPTISKKSVLKQLIESYKETNCKSHILSFSPFPSDTLHLYTECLVENRSHKLLNIIHFCPKKNSSTEPHHPGNKIRMSGRYVIMPKIFEAIKKIKKTENGESNEVVAFKQALESGQSVLGLAIDGHTYDTGSPTLYVRANTAFFKKKLSKKR